ncbi:putative protocadherin beta-18 isoform X2 [Octopus sinensis]|uniref:Protocadherin beta-18 isoform X2 n=1 Tax=Octopus sinensis TaxID=2607531 RepID=A0A6P7T3R1_9MOLL|nr:putative protocadherin beta-18 isoform X2 [Octopus sinensis]
MFYKENNDNMLRQTSLLILLFHSTLCVDLVYHVEEGKSPGTYLGNIAVDSQLLETIPAQDYNLIQFSQLQRRETQQFNITKVGEIYTAGTLDTESLCLYNKECSVIVKVAVRKAKTFMKILKIKVIIKDVNDHRPVFPSAQFNLQFDETDGKGTTKPIPNAVDGDVGILNSQITYRLKKNKNEPFSLAVSERIGGKSKLGILLEEKLDREVKDNYDLEVIATDGGSPPKQGVLKIQISVIDVNDNLPFFSKSIYNISIQSSYRKDRPIITVSATDLDSGENGKVTYHFSPKTLDVDQSHFRLNQYNGEISVQQMFGHGQKQTYKLFVEAIDGGSPSLSSSALVLVNIINQRNNPPTIDVDFVSGLKENTTVISEDIEVGSFIAYVMVIDNDNGENGEVKCEMRHEKFQLLSLAPKEYKITMKGSVDREVTSQYEIRINCRDNGSPPLQSRKVFTIKVQDVNDVQPKFIKDTFKFLTYETETANFPVGFISAVDPDLGTGGQLVYSLLNKKHNAFPFQITEYGFISTTEALDREEQNIYKFQVFVRDSGVPPLNNTANVVVEVVDENDNAPYFTFPSVDPFSLDVHYYPQSKNDITVLRAVDRDTRENAFLKYGILRGNDKQLFGVNPYTGVLSFSRTVYQNDAGAYNLKLVVKDSGSPILSAMTTVTLTLTVSNKTSTMLTAVQVQSGEMIDINLVIIIVIIAVVVSIAIVIFITTCIVRSQNGRNVTTRTGDNPHYRSRTEMKQLIYQANTAGMIARNPEEIADNDDQSIKSRSQFYPEEESQKEWMTPTIVKTFPKASKPKSKMSNYPISVTCGADMEAQSVAIVPNYLTETLSTHKDGGRVWNQGQHGDYEEIHNMAALYDFKRPTPGSGDKKQHQDSYMKPFL